MKFSNGVKQTKEVVLGIFAVILNIAVFWFWFRAAPLMAAGEFQNYGNFIIPLAGLVIAASLFALAALFIENKWLIHGSIVLGIGTPYLFVQANTAVIVLLVITLLFSAFAAYRIRKEFIFSLGFSLSKTTKAGLPIYFTVASLIISIFYFSNITEEKALSSILPKSAVGFALKNLSGPLGSLTGLNLPTLKPEATVDEILLKLVEEELKSQDVAVSRLPRPELTRAIAAQREGLAKNFGIKLKGQEKLGDVLYNTISQRTEELLGPYKKYLPVASAVAFFLAFKTLTLPLYYLTILVTFFLLKVLILSKIIRSEKQQIEVEKLTI